MRIHATLAAMVIVALLSVGCGGLRRDLVPAAAVVVAPRPGQVQEFLVPEGPVSEPVAEPVAEPVVEPLPQTPLPAPEPPAAPLRPDSSDWAAPYLEPVDPLLPEPAEAPAVWRHLDETVRRAAAGFSGRMSVVAVDLTSGARYDFRPSDRYYPASTFKLPVTLCVAEAIHRGELTWNTLVTFTEADDDTVGQGYFIDAEYGSKWPVRNLSDRSLISSNNVAVKMLARTLTWEGLAQCTADMGAMVTRTEEGSTPVSAADEAAWWLHLWRMKQERPALAENLLAPMRRTDYLGRITAGTPRPDLVTHKFGTYAPYEHDGAIVWGDRPYVLVVMSYGASHDDADAAIMAVARAAWDSIYGK